jgi:hypothetical protein
MRLCFTTSARHAKSQAVVWTAQPSQNPFQHLHSTFFCRIIRAQLSPEGACKDGLLHIRLTPENAESVKKYCRLHNVNCSVFVNDMVFDRMKELAETQYDDLTKEELIALVKRLENEHDR